MPSWTRSDVVIVGGGVMGLLSALVLGRQGLRVTLLERGEVGEESSWAGGGIVSPLYPWRYSPAVTALVSWSQDFYLPFAARLAEQVGIDPQVHPTGLYWLDLEDEVQALSWAYSEGKILSRLSIDTVRAFLPALGVDFASAIHMPGVANVRNPRLIKALHKALLGLSNVQLHEQSEVQGFLIEAGRLIGVTTPAGDQYSDRVLLAAGAWSGHLLAQLDIRLPVAPVKGQMILYKCEPGFLPAIVLAKGRYAIPRKDGHILVGSTLEHVGFDKTPTEEALASLKASAEELLPALADAEVVGHWAGLRPGSPDGIPFIGEVPQFPGLWLNCGHYRNGLVLAPASCELLKNLMLGEAPIVDPAPYAPAGRLGLV